MSRMKDLAVDILERLTETGMDYELVAEEHNVSPSEIYWIAKEYGDIEE